MSSASTPGTWLLAATWAMNSWARIIAAPIDRSIPAVRMISVCATPSAAMTATCWSISEMFAEA